MSLHSYITEINSAKELLLDEAYSVKEIRYALGFDNECGFISFFKRHTGTPPGIYRKNKIINNENWF